MHVRRDIILRTDLYKWSGAHNVYEVVNKEVYDR